MKRAIAITILCATLSGCATTARLDKRGLEYESRPPPDAGLTTRTIFIEIGKIIAAGLGGYAGSRL